MIVVTDDDDVEWLWQVMIIVMMAAISVDDLYDDDGAYKCRGIMEDELWELMLQPVGSR